MKPHQIRVTAFYALSDLTRDFYSDDTAEREQMLNRLKVLILREGAYRLTGKFPRPYYDRIARLIGDLGLSSQYDATLAEIFADLIHVW